MRWNVWLRRRTSPPKTQTRCSKYMNPLPQTVAFPMLQLSSRTFWGDSVMCGGSELNIHLFYRSDIGPNSADSMLMKQVGLIVHLGGKTL